MSNSVIKRIMKDLNSLKTLSASIENMIFSNIPISPPVSQQPWNITDQVYGTAREKATLFQNAELPQDFFLNFGIDHLLSQSESQGYIEEYKK